MFKKEKSVHLPWNNNVRFSQTIKPHCQRSDFNLHSCCDPNRCNHTNYNMAFYYVSWHASAIKNLDGTLNVDIQYAWLE